jgi:hypothetical protein
MQNRNGLLLAVPIALGLSACVSSSEVVPMGPDTYMVSTHQQGGIVSSGNLAEHSAKRANA